MKKNLITLILLAVLTLFTITLRAQDLIITSDGDSLNCKITKIKPEKIYFTFKYKDEIRNTLLPMYKVKYHQSNYFQQSEIPSTITGNKEIYPRFRAAINGGWSYRTARVSDNVPSGLKEYTKNLKSGLNYGVDLTGFFSEQIGIGLKCQNFRSKKEMDGSQYGNVSDDISICFIGPMMSTRLLNDTKKNGWFFNLGVGYLGYKDDAYVNSNMTIKGATAGICWEIGYDIGISKNMSIGFQLSSIGGTLTGYDVSNGYTTQTIQLDKENQEGLHRFDFSVGLRFTK
ncbi:MAG TPA: hypothetical protein PKH79_08165 [Prolixibacteraceae bacterium]|nr:hypothetical protein [Prolixibacteraceae bacterium]HPS13954.1 hypothetical protein [Prolixibacteraceae bacterium]